jgi:hypothetical protein
LRLREGDKILFDARSRQYIKGYRGHRDDEFGELPERQKDWRLSNPTNIRRYSQEQSLFA